MKESVSIGAGGALVQNIDQLYRLAEGIHRSGTSPFQTPAQTMTAMLAAKELGLSYTMANTSMYVANKRLGIMAKLSKALVRQAGVLKPGTSIETWTEGEGDKLVGYAKAHRNGEDKPQVREFSMADAKSLGLLGKDNWKKAPKRMVCHRAWGYLADDLFSDCLLGLGIAENMQDDEPAPVSEPQPVQVLQPEPPEGESSDPLLEGASEGAAEPPVLDAQVVDDPTKRGAVKTTGTGDTVDAETGEAVDPPELPPADDAEPVLDF